MRFTERPSNSSARFTPAGIAVSIWDHMAGAGARTRSVTINELTISFEPNQRNFLIIVQVTGWRTWFPCLRNIMRSELSVFLHDLVLPHGVYACVIVERP